MTVPAAPPAPSREVLSGWGESVHGWARVWRPRTAAETAALLGRFADEGRTAALRGAGRSYGDAALLATGDVVDLTGLRRIRSFDAASGVVEAEGGVTMEDLWRAFLPRGFWPPVVPGTMHPTVAGAFAMNVHGKNHFRAGGFCEHVEEAEVALPTGEVRRVRAADAPDLLRALSGSLGLLAAVTALRIRLRRVHSGRLRVRAAATPSLAGMVAEFERRAAGADHLVGWVDCFDPAGRGVVHEAAEFGEGEDPEGAESLAPERQALPPRLFGVLPRDAAASLLTPFARPAGIAAVNAARYRAAAARGERTYLEEHVRFAFLLDSIPGWRRLYAPGGLLQHQSFVPRARCPEVPERILATCRERGIVPWLGVLKRHRACGTILPHAVDGFSLALDFPVTADGRDVLVRLCRDLDEIAIGAGGRIYCAKDQTATADAFRRSQPGLDEFREWKRRLDPAGVLTSDLARRLAIVP